MILRSKFLFCSTLLILLSTIIGSAQNCIYPTSNLYVRNEGCSLEAEFCLDIAFADRNDFDVYVDGQPYAGTYMPCDYQISKSYNLQLLGPYLGASPQFLVDSVRIEGTLHSFSFTTLQELADSMNGLDPMGMYTIAGGGDRMEGNIANRDISFINVTELVSSATFALDFNELQLPSGSIINLANGIHEVVIDEIATACRDTITVEVFCPNNAIVIDTIDLNQIDTLCFAMDDLRGAIVSITNICPGESGMFSMIDPIPNSACIEITGLDIGRDSACLVLTDDVGLSDTIYYSILVRTQIDPGGYEAINDEVVTVVDQSVVFNPTANDAIPGVIDTIYISQDPEFGQATVNADGTITYIPNLSYQSNGTPDSLIYTICSNMDCRSATVFINVNPPTLNILTGFSPNQDGINDTFVIENLEQFPTNQLCIFNRWGNQVLQVENYQNDWDGTWDSSTVLPDGAYFYILDVEVDAQKEQHTGFVLIRR